LTNLYAVLARCHVNQTENDLSFKSKRIVFVF